ncbi:hypothetical protein SD89_08620 [Streptococcus pyogenes]|nr:hypothetical protein SD89_08620 [Streptococcus pyogenes]
MEKTKINKIENVLNKTFTINRDKGFVIYDRLRVAVKVIYEMKKKHKKHQDNNVKTKKSTFSCLFFIKINKKMLTFMFGGCMIRS